MLLERVFPSGWQLGEIGFGTYHSSAHALSRGQTKRACAGAESGQELGDVGRRLSGPVASPSIPASLQQPLMKLAHSFVLSDPNLPDQPIVYASQGFLTLTG